MSLFFQIFIAIYWQFENKMLHSIRKRRCSRVPLLFSALDGNTVPLFLLFSPQFWRYLIAAGCAITERFGELGAAIDLGHPLPSYYSFHSSRVAGDLSPSFIFSSRNRPSIIKKRLCKLSPPWFQFLAKFLANSPRGLRDRSLIR